MNYKNWWSESVYAPCCVQKRRISVVESHRNGSVRIAWNYCCDAMVLFDPR